jgi:beta-glucanase (GH16 family)
MEAVDNMSTIFGTVHGPGDKGVGVGGNISQKPFNSSDFSQAFHVFSAIWSPKKISFFVDSILYFTVTPQMISKMWVFYAPQFIILNLAIGGEWPGFPNVNTTFPVDYVIDYVRVWQ